MPLLHKTQKQSSLENVHARAWLNAETAAACGIRQVAAARAKMVLAVVVAATLTGCAGGPVGSIIGGECRAIPAPKVQMYGLAKVDQDYLDEVTEAGVAACNWPRPQARVRPAPLKVEAVAPLKPAAKKRFLDRFRKTTS